MLVLRADPWDPSYGMGMDALEAEESEQTTDPFVETTDWSAPRSPPAGAAGTGPVGFVDGVERVELGLIAEDDGRSGPGLFGSFAVGSVIADDRAVFGDHVVERRLITGAGMRAGAVGLRIGLADLRFEPVSEEHAEPERPRLRLLALMRQAEAAAARALASHTTLVLADGRIAFPESDGHPIVGFVKRFMKHHLAADQAGLLRVLRTGQRTPVFTMSRDDSMSRYSWYVRLTSLRSYWHAYAGLVRCEVSAGVGRDQAIELADRTAALLPRFAGGPHDPRTPQNLAPVARLESSLRRAMGDARLIRRELVRWLINSEGAA